MEVYISVILYIFSLWQVHRIDVDVYFTFMIFLSLKKLNKKKLNKAWWHGG